MNSQKKLRTTGTVLLLLLLSFGLNSCKKSIKTESPATQEGMANVIVNMLGIDETNEPLVSNSGATSGKLASVHQMTGQAVSSGGIQQTIVPFSDDISIVATLVPIGAPAVNETATPQGGRIAAVKPVTKAAANVISQTPLVIGTTYRVIVYNDAGVRVATKDYVRGNEGNTVNFLLDGGKTYTFVAYSVNTTTLVAPPVTNPDNLSTAIINTISGDLMYFKKTMVVAGGNNYLDIILKHKFSQITTNIVLDGGLGNITAISGVTIAPARNSASIKLANDSIAYNVSGSANVTFPTIATGGVRSISSGAKTIITPLVTNGTLAIGSLTAFGITKVNLSIPNLTITPGVKYNLNLTLQVPQCTVKDSTNFNLVTPNSPRALNILISGNSPVNKYKSVVFNITGVGGGFTMDFSYGSELISLLGVTGQTLMHPPLQLDDDVQHPRTIEFADGDKYGVGGVPTPQLLTNGTKPIIRVEVDAAGIVSMFGIKASSTDGSSIFYQLIPAPGYSFNTIRVALSAGQNQITVDPTDSADPSVSHLLIGRIIIERFVQCTN